MTAGTEFDVDLTQYDFGALIVTDPALLIRQRVAQSTEYPPHAKHDVRHANAVLRLGTSGYDTVPHHLIFKGGADEAHALLDKVFHYYVDRCCFELWCDARVSYIVNGEVARTEEYGFADGAYTLLFSVHCNVADPDAFAAELVDRSTVECVVVSPDDSELGYAARGYRAVYDDDEYVERD